MMRRFVLWVTIFLMTFTGCNGNETTPKKNYARKQFYLGHDYFMRHLKSVSRIATLLKDLEESEARKDLKESTRLRDELTQERMKADRFLDAALTELTKAIEYDPAMADAHFDLGLIYLKKATQRDDLARRLQCLRGDAGRENQEVVRSLLSRALRHFKAASRMKKYRSKCYNNMSSIYIYLGEYDPAVQAAKQALSDLVYSEPHVAQSNLGWAYFHLRKYKKAETALRQALVQEPRYCLARYRLGRVLFETGRFDDAAETLKASVRPGTVCAAYQEAHQYLALSYLRTGRMDDARRELDTCVKLAPRSCTGLECQDLLEKIR